MPLYLDIHHNMKGITTAAAAEAHAADMAIQAKHGVTYKQYWVDEANGKVFCLVDAPSREAAEAVHREAHGHVADELIEVKEGQ
jgi:hypothetical protein